MRTRDEESYQGTRGEERVIRAGQGARSETGRDNTQGRHTDSVGSGEVRRSG